MRCRGWVACPILKQSACRAAPPQALDVSVERQGFALLLLSLPLTAAHCLFAYDGDNWKCADGAVASGNSCAGGWPSWRFGTEDGTGFGNFFGSNCGWQGVTSEYVALDGTLETAAKQWTSTRYDFGFIDLYEADTIQSDIDTTQGQSGSALWFFRSPGDRRAVGVRTTGRTSDISTLNGHSRFTAAKYNWLAANTQYPEDTQ